MISSGLLVTTVVATALNTLTVECLVQELS